MPIVRLNTFGENVSPSTAHAGRARARRAETDKGWAIVASPSRSIITDALSPGNRLAVDKLADAPIVEKKDSAIAAKELWKQKIGTIGHRIKFEGRTLFNLLARPEGFEPPTLRSEV